MGFALSRFRVRGLRDHHKKGSLLEYNIGLI